MCYIWVPKEPGHSQGVEEGSGSRSSGSYGLPIVTGSQFQIWVTKDKAQGMESRWTPAGLVRRHRGKEKEES